MLDLMQPVRALKARPPDVPFGLVPRPQLAERLTKGTTGAVTLVCAGPGTSKTLTVASWAKSDDVPWPIGWLSLDASDNTLQSFWSSVLYTLSECGGLPQDSRLRDITPAAGFGPDELLDVRSWLAEAPRPIVLVLDDFQEITDENALTSFGELLDHLPESLRLVLISRSDPTLRLHRLRASGQLTEIRTAELAFTDRETAELFEVAGLPLRPEQVTVVRERTEGWPVGVRLAALSLDRDHLQAGIQRLSGTDNAIADYLIGEVLQRMSLEESDFLLRTSVVERISGPLADALTGRTDSHSLLEQFSKANAFVMSIGNGSGWFSYHRMLRELLLFRLAFERPEALRRAHGAAAQWYFTNGDHLEAITQWIAAGDYEAAGGALLRIIPKVVSPEGPALAAAVAPLAADAGEKPSLPSLLASAVCHYHRYEMPALQRDIAAARQFLDEAGDSRASAEVTLLLFDVVVSRFRGDSQAVQSLSGQVVDLVDRTPRRMLPAGPAFRIIAVLNQAAAQVWTGIDTATETTLAEGAQQASELGLLMPQLNAIGHLALLDAIRGRCSSTERRATQATAIIDRRGWGSEPQALATYLAQALVELAKGCPTEAGHHVRRGLAASGHHTDRALRLALGAAWVEVAIGRRDERAALAADARLVEGLARTPNPPATLRRWAAVVGAEALLLAGEPEKAVARIAAGMAVTDDVDSNSTLGASTRLVARERICLARAALSTGQTAAVPALIEPVLSPGTMYLEASIAAHLLQAVLADRSHRDAAAFTAMGAAIELAHAEGIRRPFVVIGDRVETVLHRYRLMGGRQDAFAADVLALLRPSSSPQVADSVTIDRLTEREAMVLRYLPTMLKAGEIADDLFVSVNTVKAHLRAIYRKLQVANRREAVEKARATGLL